MKIIRDTREKIGWEFPFYDDVEIESKKIDSGDYTTELLQNKIVIERKASTSEIANNLGRKTAKARFYRECDRMEDLKRAYIVCEFPESKVYEFPYSSGLSKAQISKIRMNGKYLRRLLSKIEEDYSNVEVVFCENRVAAEAFTYDILKFWEHKISSE
jgi:hypothetical protein